MEWSSTLRAPLAPSTDFYYGKSCSMQSKKYWKNITIRSSETATGERLATPAAQP
jgi:hypothetical protein